MFVLPCKLLTYGHQICIVGVFHITAPTDRFTACLTYTGQNVKNLIFRQPGFHES